MRYKRKNIVFKSCGDVFERKNSYIYIRIILKMWLFNGYGFVILLKILKKCCYLRFIR